MATTRFDEALESDQARPPLSLHPAFPTIVALWFAALLGLGSLMLPVVLLERAVEASGIAAVVPAANPPLGFTARSLVAIVGALAGAGLGLAVARRVAGAHRPSSTSRAAKLTAGARAPIRVKDEVGGEGVTNGESLPINRRRALAISEDDRASDFLYHAPLPGDGAEAETPSGEPETGAEPLDLSDVAEVVADPSHQDHAMTDPFEPEQVSSHQTLEIEEQEGPSTDGSDEPAEPLPFSAPSLARRIPEHEIESRLAAIAAIVEPSEQEGRADWETAPVEDLGLVQLVQRLGSAIERRRELMAKASSAPTAAPYVASAGFEAAPAEEAAQAMAAYFGSAPAPQAAAEIHTAPEAGGLRPGFLQGLSADDEDEDEDDFIPSFTLPVRRDAEAATSAADPSLERDGYGSLLSGRSETPARRFDVPESASTPSAQPPVDADEALRAALATLQRMSGAA